MASIPTAAATSQTQPGARVRAAISEPRWMRTLLIGLTLGFLGLFLFVPLVAVFVNAFSKGIGAFAATVADPDAISAIRLTLLTAAIAVPLNVVFGVAAAWSIAKFEFKGKSAL